MLQSRGHVLWACVLNIEGRVSNSSYSQIHTLAVAVFTVTVLWKAVAAMSSHPAICQRGCFSILGIGSEIHRPIHTSQIDMLAQTQAITNIDS